MGIQIANVCHCLALWSTSITNTAFKPALDELYKKHPVSTKICLVDIQSRNFFAEDGTFPPTRHPDDFGASILVPKAL